MGTYVLDNRFLKVGEVILQSGMTLRSNGVEGICGFYLDKLYLYPADGEQPSLITLGDEVEVLSTQLNKPELERRKQMARHRQLSWQEQIGEENTRQFDSSNQSWG